MANSLSVILASVLITLVAGSAIAFVGLPMLYPSISSEKKGIIQTVEKSWQDESYIFDTDLSWNLMNKTQLNLTISENSKIEATFSAPFLLSLDTQFTTMARFEVALVIQGVGNTSTTIIYYDDTPASGHYRQISYFPTLSFMTGPLSAGTYNCTVQWKSAIDSPGTGNNLSVSHHNLNSAYHYDRWMRLEELST